MLRCNPTVAPSCRECVHFRPARVYVDTERRLLNGLCAHPSASLSEKARHMRKEGGACGPEGTMFELSKNPCTSAIVMIGYIEIIHAVNIASGMALVGLVITTFER